jgi:hypothetical protein
MGFKWIGGEWCVFRDKKGTRKKAQGARKKIKEN